jgi:VIT1/CCC1 family predicted Fe2+/Mn2+ transporter
VAFLVTPYFLLTNIYACLAIAIGLALMAILAFTYYTSVAQGLNFRQRFWEMAWMSLLIAAITFLLGLGARQYLGVNI